MKLFEEFYIENFYLLEENLNGGFSNIYKKLFEFFELKEDYLGIKGIDKSTQEKIEKSRIYWALYAHFYEKIFGNIDDKSEIEAEKIKLMKRLKDRRSKSALDFFADFRKKEIDINNSGKNADKMSYIDILTWKN